MPAFAVPANLAFDSYTALIAAVSDWMDRDDLTGSAPQMIALAEAKMARELEPMFSEKSGSVVSVAGATSLPADCGIMRTAVYNSRVVPQIAPSQGVIIAQGSSPLSEPTREGEAENFVAFQNVADGHGHRLHQK